MVHALTYFGGVPLTVLTDNMKTVVLDRVDGQPRFHAKLLDFASYYGFLPRVCHPYRPQTKGKIESTIRYIKSSFWPGLWFDSLADLNRQARTWVRGSEPQSAATTRESPLERWPREGLTPLDGQPAYDTSYVSHRQVAKDCLVSYRGNRYSMPHVHAGRSVLIREPLEANTVRIFYQQERIAEHRLSTAKGATVIDPDHYAGLPRRSRVPVLPTPTPVIERTPGPGVGLHHAAPEVELLPLSIYQSFCGGGGAAMSLQSERLLAHMQRLRLSHLPTVMKHSPKRPPPRTCLISTSSNRRSKPRARPSIPATCG